MSRKRAVVDIGPDRLNLKLFDNNSIGAQTSAQCELFSDGVQAQRLQRLVPRFWLT